MKKVLCVDNMNTGNVLKRGEEYEVVDERDLGSDGSIYSIRCGNGCNTWFSSKRFKIINEVEDIVNNPNHYKGNKGIETIDFIENVLTREEFIGYLRGNVIKYQSRANLKGRKEEDLKKAKWYSDKLVEVLKDEK